MKNEILKLRNQYVATRNVKQREEIDRQMKELAAQDPAAFAAAMVELAHETAVSAKELRMREQLNDILPAISLAYIAKTYFGKTRQWLYQRINGSLVNGKPAKMTPDEAKNFEFALKDLGARLSSLHVSP